MDIIFDWMSFYLNKKTIRKLKIANLNKDILIKKIYITNVYSGFK